MWKIRSREIKELGYVDSVLDFIVMRLAAKWQCGSVRGRDLEDDLGKMKEERVGIGWNWARPFASEGGYASTRHNFWGICLSFTVTYR